MNLRKRLQSPQRWGLPASQRVPLEGLYRRGLDDTAGGASDIDRPFDCPGASWQGLRRGAQAVVHSLPNRAGLYRTPPGSLTDRRQRVTHGYPAVLACQSICCIADAGLDDQKFFEYCGAQRVDFIIRAANDRWVEVFNERLNRWEREHLKDLVDSVPGCLGFATSFTHAGKVVQARVILDWFKIRIPETHQILWVVAAQTEGFPDPLVLFTNRPVSSALEA